MVLVQAEPLKLFNAKFVESTKLEKDEEKPNISKESIKIDPPNGDWITYKHTLNDKQILHFIVLYRLCYLKAHYPDKFDTIQDIPSSTNMNEYFSKSKEELQDVYNKVKVDVGAN